MAGWAMVGQSWVAYADCEIAYKGSALAYLQKGSYIILRKSDGSVSIQGGDLNQPRNYIRSTKIEVHDDVIICSNKKEELKIKIYGLFWKQYMTSWGTGKVELYRTERQLVQKLIKNIDTWIPQSPERIITEEYRTACGPVDVGIEIGQDLYLLEVKRRVATIKDCTQVMRYRDHVPHAQPRLYLVAPNISDNGLKYAEQNNITYIQLEWDEVPIAFAKLIND